MLNTLGGESLVAEGDLEPLRATYLRSGPKTLNRTFIVPRVIVIPIAR
jgi:hypothetical protein